MKGWLVYARENILRNQRFIDFFMAAANRRGVELAVVCADQIATGVRGGKPFVLPQPPDFAVMRGMFPLLSHQLEECGAYVFNSARVSDICNDKRATHRFLTALGLPTLDTAFVSRENAAQPFDYPLVVKASGGCGGRQVFLCEDDGAYRAALERIYPDTAVAQPLCDTPGQDVRAYVLFGRVVQAMRRYSNGDFRSNFGLNGLAETWQLTDEQAGYVKKIANELRPGLVGVDFIFHGGRCYVNEIEDAVGTRMLYQYTDIQIVDMYLNEILKNMG